MRRDMRDGHAPTAVEAHFDTAPADSRNKKRGRSQRSEVGKNRENQPHLSPSLPPPIYSKGGEGVTWVRIREVWLTGPSVVRGQ